MIYSTTFDKFPEEGQFIECESYKDENDFEWKIARVENGFFVAYFGHDYFKETYHSIEVNGKDILLINTGCFFIKSNDFDTFYQIRNILINGYTDDIWDCIAVFLTTRLESDSGLMDCEITNP